MTTSRVVITLFYCLLLCSALFSCVNTKKAAYFYGVNDTTIASANSRIPKPVIQQNDILTISVSSANPEADIPYNLPNTLAMAPGMNVGTLASQTTGYLVTEDGTVQFPVLGTIKVSGLTKTEIKQLLTKQLADNKLLVDPIVTIRIINFRVTVMGEVRNPGVITVPSERVSLLEALGLAGDLTVYGKRDNILLIRETDGGEKLLKRLNINARELFDSPYYYLQSNDVIYVEANAAKLASADRSWQVLPVILSSLSVVAVIVGIILR